MVIRLILVFIIIMPLLRALDAERATLCPPAELPVPDAPISPLETHPDATPRSKQDPGRALQLGAPPAAFGRLLPHLLKHICVGDPLRVVRPRGGFPCLVRESFPSVPDFRDQLL